MTVSRKSFALLALASLASAALAAPTNVTALDGSQNWHPVDQRGNTSYTIDSIPGDNGDGALHLTGTASPAGTARNYIVYGANPASSGAGFPSLGTLGQLVDGSMSIDLFRNTPLGTPSVSDKLQLAVKLIFSGDRQLTWENAYNSNFESAGSWNTVDIGSGNWWMRTGGINYNGGSDAATLGSWESGFMSQFGLNSDSQILGYAIGFGGGVGDFDGAADSLIVNYDGGSSTEFNFGAGNTAAVPGPAAMSAFALGLALRRRKRA